jgi:hypothetical protein
MRKILGLTLVLLFLTSLFVMVNKPVSGASAVADSWVILAPMHQSRGGLGVVAVNNSIFAIGGCTGGGIMGDLNGGFLGTNEQYNVEADNWTYRTPMPTTRDHFAIAVYENKIYCFGGHIDNGHIDDRGMTWTYAISCNVTEVYDVATDKWETKTPMPINWMDIEATVLDGKILVKAKDPSNYPNSPNFVYDPVRDSWSNTTASSPSLFGSKTGPYEVYNGWTVQTSGADALRRTYVVGLLTLKPYRLLTINEMYDSNTNSWSMATNMSLVRSDFGLAMVNDVIYVVGGSIVTCPSGYTTPTKVNEAYFPVGYGSPDPAYVFEHTSPNVTLDVSLNATFKNSTVPLVFYVDKKVSWMGYSLDGGPSVSVDGNTTIANLTNGVHSLIIYANDTYGNYAAPQTLNFTVAVPEPFPVLVFAAVTATLGAVIAAIVVVVYRRHRAKT